MNSFGFTALEQLNGKNTSKQFYGKEHLGCSLELMNQFTMYKAENDERMVGSL